MNLEAGFTQTLEMKLAHQSVLVTKQNINSLLDFLQLRGTGLPSALGVLEDLPDPDCLADAARLAARRPRAPPAHLAVARGPCNVSGRSRSTTITLDEDRKATLDFGASNVHGLTCHRRHRMLNFTDPPYCSHYKAEKKSLQILLSSTQAGARQKS